MTPSLPGLLAMGKPGCLVWIGRRNRLRSPTAELLLADRIGWTS